VVVVVMVVVLRRRGVLVEIDLSVLVGKIVAILGGS
jgi:ABC-type transporter Mla maintaining outer membrane lipid asymmetry ATPase subunit MlaF